MARPRKPDKPEEQIVSVRMPKELKNRVQVIADMHHRSLSAQILVYIEDGLIAEQKRDESSESAG